MDKHLQSSAVELVGEDVYVVGEEVVRLDPKTGSKLWASSLPGGAPSFMRLSLAGERVVAADQGRVVAFARKDGAVAWTHRAVAAQVVSLAVEGGRVLASERRSGEYALVALELSSGKVAWDAAEPRRQQTPLLMEGTRLCYATDVALVCRDLADGREVMRAPVPYSLLLLDAAPWRLSLVGRRLVLATNVAVAAYDLDAGAWAFASDHTSRTHLPLRLLSRAQVSAAPQADSTHSADAPWTSTLPPSEFFVWQAQRNLDFARSRTQLGSVEQRRRAQSDAALAAHGVSMLSSIHSSFERTEAVVAFTGALLGVFDAMKADFQRAEALDHAWEDADALRAHGRMLQDRFHVRQLDTDDLQLIDVSAGTVGRIGLRMYDQLLRTRVRTAVVVDGGKALITTAPHTDKARRASQGKVSWRSSEYDLVPQYLTLMELGDVELRPLPAPRGNMWMRVANTIAKGDLELLPKLLVYANKPDPDQLVGGSFRITPLMLAAYLGQLEVAKWLLGQGAGLDARDVVGWRPIDYARAGQQPAMVEFLSSVAAGRRAAAAPSQP